MGTGRPVRPPVLEIGLKGYCWGEAAVRLAVEADRLAGHLGVSVVLAAQAVDLPAIAAATRHVLVYAQHMDPLPPGRGVGGVLAEALRDAGAAGTLLNHSERPMVLDDTSRAVARARETGLGTLVFAATPGEAATLAHLGPDMILGEPPELIATGRSAGSVMAGFVEETAAAVRAIDSTILVLGGAGVTTPADVAGVIHLGLDGVGTSSGILMADDPVRVMREMLETLAGAWANRAVHVTGMGE